MYRSPQTTPKTNPKAKKKSEPMPGRGITKAMMGRLIEHSKQHGGMKSEHMKSMLKSVKAGDTFSEAHKKAKALDMKKKNKGKK